jgi:group II intron reverse transcriptase/maturase
MSNRTASENRPESAAPKVREEPVAGERIESASPSTASLWDQVLERTNLQRALKQVRQNQGAPGIDGMTVDDLPDFLRQNWPRIRTQLEAGQYCPQPVKRVRIPKADGRERLLGIPTVLDRFIQQAIAQVISAQWDPHFHPRSYGFRPGKSAHQAVKRLQADLRAGSQWTVDLDLAAFFDRVNHDRLMQRLKTHVPDRRLLRLIGRFLTAGVLDGSHREPTVAGVPQGGPLSPVLANVVLDELDWELDRRGHRFVRYADDCQILVRSRRAGERVMRSVSRLIEDSLRLEVNARKSAVDRPWKRQFLGFTVARGDLRLKVAPKALLRLKTRLRVLTRRTRGHRLTDVVADLRDYLLGWQAYFGIAEVPSPLREIDQWLRRRLRCYLWKQWGRSGYRQLRRHGVSVRDAWQMAKSAHGPWRLSHTPALARALPAQYFADLGLPRLVAR